MGINTIKISTGHVTDDVPTPRDPNTLRAQYLENSNNR